MLVVFAFHRRLGRTPNVAEMTGGPPNTMALAIWTRRHGQERADTRERITHSAPALMGSMAGKRTKPLCHRLLTPGPSGAGPDHLASAKASMSAGGTTRVVPAAPRPRPPALRGRHRRGAGGGRPAGDPALPRPAREVYRQEWDRAHGAPGRSGRARVPRRAGLDSPGGGPRTWSAPRPAPEAPRSPCRSTARRGGFPSTQP